MPIDSDPTHETDKDAGFPGHSRTPVMTPTPTPTPVSPTDLAAGKRIYQDKDREAYRKKQEEEANQ